MKHLLVIGASILQLPAIIKAKEMGLYVGVVDYNPNAVGVKYADEYFEVSTIDKEGVYQAAKQFSADGITTLATDMPMRAISYATKMLNLVGISPETAIKATDKGEMIKAFQESQVDHPWYYIVRSREDLLNIRTNLSFPCISKPVDNSGSRGVELIENIDSLDRAVEYSSSNGRNGEVIIEEYLTGTEVSVEIIVVKGKVYILQVTDKLTTGAPHFVEMGHSQPSRLKDEDVNKIKILAEKAVKAVGIENGPAHVEIMMTKNGPKMIELGARLGGDYITSHLVPLSTGIDMIEASIRIALGEEPDLESTIQKASAVRYFREAHGVIKNICNIDAARTYEGVKEIFITKEIGETVGAIASSVDRIGSVISQAETPDMAIACCEKALEIIRVETEEL